MRALEGAGSAPSRFGVLILALLVATGPATLALSGCAANKQPPVEIVWTNLDGGSVADADLDAAAALCRKEVEGQSDVKSKRRDYMSWGVQMIDCMEAHGFKRTERVKD